MIRTDIIVGPWNSTLPYTWSFVYFHNKAEFMNDRFVNVPGSAEFVAPDLVGSNTNLDNVADGRFIPITHVNGDDLYLYLWTYSYEHRGLQPPAIHRHGLIITPDDDEAYEYASKCHREKRGHL